MLFRGRTRCPDPQPREYLRLTPDRGISRSFHHAGRAMRLKTALWVAAYLRRCQVEGISGVVRRRGAEEAGAIFVRISRLDGTSELFGPAPQSAFDAAQGATRAFTREPCHAIGARCGGRRLSRATGEIRSGCLDHRGGGSRRAKFSRCRDRLNVRMSFAHSLSKTRLKKHCGVRSFAVQEQCAGPPPRRAHPGASPRPR